MARKRYSAEQIIGLLRQADVELGKGRKVPEVCKALGIHEVTYYRWRAGWHHQTAFKCYRRRRAAGWHHLTDFKCHLYEDLIQVKR